MEKTAQIQLRNPQLTIVRELAVRPDYQPDWRTSTVQAQLGEIANAADRVGKTRDILERESDPLVQQLLEFHSGQSVQTDSEITYAIACAGSKKAALTVKALVVAGRTAEEIADLMGTTPANILVFESLYFDARRYLHKRVWLREICYGETGHRWLQVAFNRGWNGVQETVLQDTQQRGPKFHRTLRVLSGRADDYIRGLEGHDVALSKQDLEMLSRVCEIASHPQIRDLEDSEETEPTADSPILQRFASLPAGGRERVVEFLGRLVQAAEQRVSGSQAPAPSTVATQPDESSDHQ